MRYRYSLPAIDKYQLLAWAKKFEHCMHIDAHRKSDPLYRGVFDFRLAVDAWRSLESSEEFAFDSLERFLNDPDNDWVFGGLAYDLKNELEDLHSENKDVFQEELMQFFVPRYFIEQRDKELILFSKEALDVEQFVQEILEVVTEGQTEEKIEIYSDLSKSEYIQKIEVVKEHIQVGDIYEMNFCQNFYARDVKVSTLDLFRKLNENSQAPFSTFYRNGSFYLLSASPERYIHREGRRIVSQPIKGTRKRGNSDAQDKQLKDDLLNSFKDKIENVMIVDLVRNDLSKYAAKSTVQVEELFGVYSFPHVHQMISTVSCELRDESDYLNMIKGSFPMGSMTGAPKVRAMELIEELETFKRSFYSGAFGYFDPERNYDFNVVIRSLMYDEQKKYLAFPVGGAITISSSPEGEYEECLVKIQGILKALNASLVNVF